MGCIGSRLIGCIGSHLMSCIDSRLVGYIDDLMSYTVDRMVYASDCFINRAGKRLLQLRLDFSKISSEFNIILPFFKILHVF